MGAKQKYLQKIFEDLELETIQEVELKRIQK